MKESGTPVSSEGEKKSKRLTIEKGIPLEKRVEKVSQHFGVSRMKLLHTLGDLEDFLLEGQDFVFSEDQRRSNFGRGTSNYFERELHNSGISRSHAQNLVLGVVDELAGIEDERETPRWVNTRKELLTRLRTQIDS